MARGLLDHVEEAWEVPRDLLLGRYPPFVTGGTLPRGDVPVFVLHGAEPRSLEPKLRHLAENGYETLTASEYLGVLTGEREAPERAVVLTFDDGRGSVWSVAHPLLARHGMKAVVFLVPGRMRSRAGPPAPTWSDVLAGRAKADAVLDREQGDGALLSWEEVEALAGTGLFDFQSHTLTHARVHVSPRVEGFVTPASRRGYDAFDQPLLRAAGRDLLGEEAPLGAPLLRSVPRTAEALRFFEDEEARQACVDRVAAEGGPDFFDHPGWVERLRRCLPRRPLAGRVETPQERSRALMRELAEAKRLIEEHTARPVTHLCYPWHAFGPTAERLALEAGYRTAFCGKVGGVPLTRRGDDPRRIARLGEDYVELLPGRGRSTLLNVLRRKWRRRFGGGRVVTSDRP
jgi:peptidoglycan/xylan/chitin deacetylase (PgdA/CDA1 family)